MLRPQSGQRRGVGRLLLFLYPCGEWQLSYFVDDGFGRDGDRHEPRVIGLKIINLTYPEAGTGGRLFPLHNRLKATRSK